MGCAASTAAHPVQQAPQPAGGAGHHGQQQQQQHQLPPSLAAQQRPGQAPTPQQPAATETMKSAPLVKSLVALHRGRCSIERDGNGCFLKTSCMAATPGEAVLYFRATGVSDDSLDSLAADEVSRQRFEAGNSQSLRLFVCSDDLHKCLEGFSEEEGKHQLVLDIRSDSADVNSVTVQRSALKVAEEGDALQVVKQWVQCGSAVRSLGALYGTLPNPKRLADGTAGAGDADGGDCVICLSKPRDVVILHCRHVCLCTACAKITSSTWSFQCPVCRGRVAAMVGLDEATDQG